eukprot:CAMPEP_0205865738 /NCGR_PEP_ID=MMETSP1083-20121108/8049_1 /ASSEMBLY_ACC=CAM_ASM_000430 /TAXON_ID=97485 /ORGANISM="Prymnesium parvum, Strain Texoma1" /LENGTH=197 /DNA_ID=CAMNT_0053227701 /DNA_START=711 /DNA_END=1304 /DNA_ORIENTATION=+
MAEESASLMDATSAASSRSERTRKCSHRGTCAMTRATRGTVRAEEREHAATTADEADECAVHSEPAVAWAKRLRARRAGWMEGAGEELSVAKREASSAPFLRMCAARCARSSVRWPQGRALVRACRHGCHHVPAAQARANYARSEWACVLGCMHVRDWSRPGREAVRHLELPSITPLTRSHKYLKPTARRGMLLWSI